MTLSRENLPSLMYWEQNQDKICQRFYLAFCLLTSGIQDTFLGLYERDRQNLNWSVACSYYGLMHCGRLLSFMAFGDFPMQHNRLPELFNFTLSPGSKPYKAFNWLCKFDSNFSQNPGQPLSDYQTCMIDYLEEAGVSNVQSRLKTYGTILKSAKDLRNDVNYESLLIAHEYRHVSMSFEFRRLANAMTQGAEYSLGLSRDAFTSFLQYEYDQKMNSESLNFRAFLTEYLQFRIQNAISNKLNGNQRLVERLNDFISELTPSKAVGGYHEIEDIVSRNVFDGKSQLMRDFSTRVDKLARATTSGANR
jgi:uncharacterized protein YbcV (DUF1398 family)